MFTFLNFLSFFLTKKKSIPKKKPQRKWRKLMRTDVGQWKRVERSFIQITRKKKSFLTVLKKKKKIDLHSSSPSAACHVDAPASLNWRGNVETKKTHFHHPPNQLITFANVPSPLRLFFFLFKSYAYWICNGHHTPGGIRRKKTDVKSFLKKNSKRSILRKT